VAEVSAPVHEALDREVRRLVDEAEANAAAIVAAHRPALDHLVERIVAEETLDGDEVQLLLRPVAEAAARAAAPARKTATPRRSAPTRR
jgi:cell division protease FtsH